MTKSQALTFRNDYLAKGARDFTKPSHFELPELLEVHIEAVAVTYSDFHDLSGGVKYPKKETIDKFGIAAGVSYKDLPSDGKRQRGEPFVCRSQAYTMGPDGQPIMGDVCVYEFDPELRAEEDFLKNPQKYQTEAAKRLKVLEFEKVGHQRANTGARSRATLSVLGLQTGFKDLKPNEIFLFSRIMVNTKNQLLAQAMINNLAGNTAALFGPKPGAQAIAAPTAEPRRLSPEDDFDPSAVQPDANPYRSALKEALEKYRGDLGPKAISAFEAALADEHTTDQVFSTYLKQTKDFLAGRGIEFQVSLGGAA